MPRVSQEHKDARRREITEAALRCVLREGFHKTTMADIIRESGLSAGAVYGYFSSKTEIILALVQLSIGGTLSAVQQRLESDVDLGLAEPLDDLVHAIDRLARDPEGDLTVVGVQAWAEAMRDPEVHEILAPQMRAVRALWQSIAEREIARGRLPSGADPEQVARVMTGLMPGFIVQRALLQDMDPEGYADAFRALLSAGVPAAEQGATAG